ncbi:MAG: GNAT family N-acetyltransferase [Planctomycetaceae bacterium]
MTVAIRAANLSDLESLQRIETAAFSSEKYPLTSQAQFQRLLNKAKNIELFVATRRSEVVGYILLFYRSNSQWGRLYSIAVHPDSQGSDVGKRLFDFAEQRILKRKLKGLTLEIREDNQRHFERYLKRGYVQVAEVSDYYPDGAAAIKRAKCFRKRLTDGID